MYLCNIFKNGEFIFSLFLLIKMPLFALDSPFTLCSVHGNFIIYNSLDHITKIILASNTYWFYAGIMLCWLLHSEEFPLFLPVVRKTVQHIGQRERFGSFACHYGRYKIRKSLTVMHLTMLLWLMSAHWSTIIPGLFLAGEMKKYRHLSLT